jgi:hypothetical protein
MAHYAFLDDNNVVTEVITGIHETETIEGLDTETWYGNLKGKTCKRTSYNGTIRKNYAAVGDFYYEDFDAFVSPQPYPSWTLDYTTFQWVPPVPYPEKEEGFTWMWSEYNQNWIKR